MTGPSEQGQPVGGHRERREVTGQKRGKARAMLSMTQEVRGPGPGLPSRSGKNHGDSSATENESPRVLRRSGHRGPDLYLWSDWIVTDLPQNVGRSCPGGSTCVSFQPPGCTSHWNKGPGAFPGGGSAPGPAGLYFLLCSQRFKPGPTCGRE